MTYACQDLSFGCDLPLKHYLLFIIAMKVLNITEIKRESISCKKKNNTVNKIPKEKKITQPRS